MGTLLPLAYLTACVVRYAVDVPLADQWALVPLVEKMYRGTLTLKDLLAQHNEHRPFFPKLWMLSLIRLTSWNLAYELAGNILLATVLFLMIRRQLALTFRSAAVHQPTWLLPTLSMVIFSLHQSSNWLSGYPVAIFMNALPAVSGLFLLSRPNLQRSHGWAALFLGGVSTLSFSSGLLYGSVGLLVLWVGTSGRPDRIPWLWAWGLLGAGLIFVYALTCHRPPHHFPLERGSEHPLKLIQYILNYLGAPLFPRNPVRAGWAGVAGTGLVTWLGWRLRAIEKFPPGILLPYGALALYALGTACLTGIGRVGFGVAQALSSRDITFANLFWIAALVLLALTTAKKPAKSGWALCCVAGLALLVAFNSIRARNDFRDYHRSLSAARVELFRLRDDSKLRLLFPNPDIIRQCVPILSKYRLSVFRNLTT